MPHRWLHSIGGFVFYHPPSQAAFARSGDRRAGKIVIGGSTSGATISVRLTTDNSGIVATGGANSLPIPAVTFTYCQGALTAYTNRPRG